MAFSDSKDLRIFVNQLEVSQFFKNWELPQDSLEWDTTCFNQPSETFQLSGLRPGNTMKLSGGYYTQTTVMPLDTVAKAGQRAQMLATVCPAGCGDVGATGLVTAPLALQIAGWGHNLQSPASVKQLVGIAFDIKSQSPGVLRGAVLHNSDGGAAFWRASIAYATGTYIYPKTDNGHLYLVSDGGASDATTEPTWPTSGGTVTNGTCVFTDMGLLPWVDLGGAYSGNWAFGAHFTNYVGSGTHRMQLFHSTDHVTWSELTHLDFSGLGAAHVLGNGSVHRYIRWGGSVVTGSAYKFGVVPFFDTYL